MNLSWKFLSFILLTQFLILGTAFLWFSKTMNRAQLEREADIFSVTTNLQYVELLADSDNSLTDALLGTVRHISRLKGIIGAQLYNEAGELVLSIPEIRNPDDLPLLNGQAQATFHRKFDLDQFAPASPETPSDQGMVLQMDIPLSGQQGQTVAFLRFYRDGASFWDASRQQQRLLAVLAIFAIILTSGVTTFIFALYDGRLKRSRDILQVKNEELLNAQQHLLLSSKMTAIGSMTAHLIHDLKSYANRILHSLHQVGERNHKLIPMVDEACHNAADMDRRIREFLNIFHNQSTEFQSSYSAEELLSIIHQKVDPVAKAADLVLKIEYDQSRFSVDFNQGNFLILILQNLLHNAIEVTRPDEKILLQLLVNDEVAEFRVIDKGPGIPSERRANLFNPQNSFKRGGTGLGLAICAQMAFHIEADLVLEASDFTGSCFLLTLPVKIIQEDTE